MQNPNFPKIPPLFWEGVDKETPVRQDVSCGQRKPRSGRTSAMHGVRISRIHHIGFAPMWLSRSSGSRHLDSAPA
jgi:hypothetical protein